MSSFDLPLPFHVDTLALRAHAGLNRCSATAKALWLLVLVEAYCAATLHRSSFDQATRRAGLDRAAVMPIVQELLRSRVFKFDGSSRIVPMSPSYLWPDFWLRVRSQNSRDDGAIRPPANVHSIGGLYRRCPVEELAEQPKGRRDSSATTCCA